MLPSKGGLLHLCGAFEPLFCQDVAVLLRSWNTRSPPGDDPTSTAARRRVVRPNAEGKTAEVPVEFRTRRKTYIRSPEL